MKVKKVTLFEQSATPEWHYEPGGDKKPEMVMDVIFSGFDPSYSDNYIYVNLYRVGEDTILLQRVRAKGVLSLDRKDLMKSFNDYENIRVAIKNFDALLETWKNEFGAVEHIHHLDYGF